VQVNQFTDSVKAVFKGNILDKFLGCTSPDSSTGYCSRTSSELAMFQFGAISNVDYRRETGLSVGFFLDNGVALDATTLASLNSYLSDASSSGFGSEFQAQILTNNLGSAFPFTGSVKVVSPLSSGGSPSPSADDGLSTGAIIGIVLGVVAAVAILLVIAWCICNRRSSADPADFPADGAVKSTVTTTDLPTMGAEEVKEDEHEGVGKV